MSLVSDELKQQSMLASQVFPEKMDAFYLFADRVFEDVVKIYTYKYIKRESKFNMCMLV